MYRAAKRAVILALTLVGLSSASMAQTARDATNRMIDLLISRWGFSEVHAYILCSVALKLRLSQVVNEPMYTVSAAISKQVLPRRSLFASA